MVTRPKTVLLTGASGVVGTALLSELARDRVIVLTHHRAPRGHAEQVYGDLTEPRLGLDTDTYDMLTERVDTVIHCAAVTDFAAGASATSDLNIRGTENILRFTADANAVLHYVSTAFVVRNDACRQRIGEATADPSHYLASKRVAEQMVRDAPVKATIVRPSVVIGDSLTGEIAKFQGLHTLISAVLKNSVPLLPLDPDSMIDFVSQDLVAKAIAGLAHHDIDSGEYWVTAGKAALTTRKLIDIVVTVGQFRGLDVIAPRLVAPDMIDRLIRPVFIAPLPEKDRRRFDDLLAMSALFGAAHPFESTLTHMPGVQAATEIELENAFAASVRYLAESKNIAPRRLEVCA